MHSYFIPPIVKSPLFYTLYIAIIMPKSLHCFQRIIRVFFCNNAKKDAPLGWFLYLEPPQGCWKIVFRNVATFSHYCKLYLFSFLYRVERSIDNLSHIMLFPLASSPYSSSISLNKFLS